MGKVRFFALFLAAVRFFTSASRAVERSLRSLRSGPGPWLKFKQHPHARQHGGVEPVGLGKPAGGLGEAPCLARVDLDEKKACIRQHAFEGPVIGTTSRFRPGFDPIAVLICTETVDAGTGGVLEH